MNDSKKSLDTPATTTRKQQLLEHFTLAELTESPFARIADARIAGLYRMSNDGGKLYVRQTWEGAGHARVLLEDDGYVLAIDTTHPQRFNVFRKATEDETAQFWYLFEQLTEEEEEPPSTVDSELSSMFYRRGSKTDSLLSTVCFPARFRSPNGTGGGSHDPR